ncbi:MAG: RagB/SusD family nutrient uptake outer membrane protein, partial [Bacteroidales bacterium]|nr:RagB/SusD family nutrient uptake outer membrane protein [Bacteroidales bacterium]
ATKGAALAYKARIALWNGDYATAATAAMACMNLNVYQLHDNYRDLFTASWSNEWIFFYRGDVTLKRYYWAASDVQNCISRLAGGWGGQKAPSYELVCAYPCTDGKPIDESPLYNPKDIFENRDPRMAMTIVPFATAHNKSVLDGTYHPEDYVWLGYEYSPDPTRTTVYRASDGAQVSNTDSKARAEHASYDGFLFKKYIDSRFLENNYGGAPTTYPMLRYGDVLLMYAEAMIELNQCTQEVLDATINKLRERAYAGAGLAYPQVVLGTQAAMRTILRTERFIELAWEGHRYADLLRWRLAETVYNRPSYFLLRAWSGSASWNGDEGSVSAEYRQLIQNWKDGNYPVGGVPDIDENGIADLSGMVDAGYIVVASERVFDAGRDYLWPVPDADRMINDNLDQNPNW